MLKHVSTLSLDTSRRSLRTSGRLSLAWEDGDEVEMLSTGRPPASLATLPRPRDKERETSLPSLSPSSPWSFRVTLSPESEPESDVELVSGQSRPQSGVRAIKVYAQCLRPHLSYKTVVVTPHTTSKQVILGLLSRFRMRHRDPNLFYLTMEVTVGPEGRQTITLEDNTRPVEMISCNPWATPKFILQTKQGGLVKVFDHLVRVDSVYKSLIISEETTVQDTIQILRCCYREDENAGKEVDLRLWEVGGGAERLLGEKERPLKLMEAWTKESSRRFLLRSVASMLKESPKCLGIDQSLLKKRFLWSMLGPTWGGEEGGSENESEFNTSSSSSSSSSDCLSTSSCESSFLVLTDGFLT